MYGYNYGTASHAHATSQGYTSNPAAPGYASNQAYAPAPVIRPPSVPVSTRSPSPPALNPVPVPPGCYPIELVQFWRDEYKRGHPFPLHWALFVRTAPRCSSTHGRTVGSKSKSKSPTPTPSSSSTPRGNFYELVGTQETYTAQFLQHVTFEPDMVPDWRGTHVIGWVSPGQLAVFEGVVRQVRVWRGRPDWRSQHWVYEAVSAVGGNYQGVFMDGVTFGGLQRHMGRLLDAWENGDI